MSSTPADLRNAIEAFRPSAGGPVPTDPWTAQYWDMAGAHVTFLNALFAIYEQAPHVPPEKHVNFIGYCLLWCAVVHSHHEYEEETYFAMYEPKIDTSFVQEEHDAFQKGMSVFETYLISCLPPSHEYGLGKSTSESQVPIAFDGTKLQGFIDEFAPPLAEHLIHEVTYLEPEKLKAAGMTEGEMKHIGDVTDAYIKKFPITRFLTFAVLCKPSWVNFPPVPGFVKSFLVPYVLSIPYRHFWEFVPKSN